MRERKYSVICILEGQVTAGSKQEAQRRMEDTLYRAFDERAAKDSNPSISRIEVCIGGHITTTCGMNADAWGSVEE
jgi:hypothetical protein